MKTAVSITSHQSGWPLSKSLQIINAGKGVKISAISHVEPKNMIQMNLFTKQKQIHRHRKETYSYQKGKGGEG